MQPTRSLIAAGLALGLAGCLEVDGPPDSLPDQCSVAEDCAGHANGAVCFDGTCYGDPSADLIFAAVLVPPPERDDLVTSEIGALEIAQDGTIGGLVFAAPITLAGRIVLASSPEATVAAQIRIERPPLIPGGPAFLRTVVAEANVAAAEPNFTLQLPPTRPGDPPYQVTVLPANGFGDGVVRPTPAELAPPLHFALTASEDQTNLNWPLGDPAGLTQISGRVVDAAGRGLADLQVSALARPELLAPFERISSLAWTDGDGNFAILVPRQLSGPVDLVVEPSPGTLAPTLRATGVVVPGPGLQGPVALETLVMPSYPNPVRYVLPVRGPDPAGGTVPATGADVRLTLELPSKIDLVVTYTASGTTDAEGNVALELLPGGDFNRLYVADVAPSPLSPMGVARGVVVEVGPPAGGVGGGVLPPVQLEYRISVGGQVVDFAGEGLVGTTVRAAPTTRFKWSLAPEQRTLLDSLRFPEVTADGHGGFVLWLDPTLLGAAASYELELIPPSDSLAPRWSHDRVSPQESDDDPASMDLGVIAVPPASFARGLVSAGGDVVPGAEVHLYQLGDDDTLCAGEPDGCEPPARLRGIWRVDDEGWVKVVLPRP